MIEVDAVQTGRQIQRVMDANNISVADVYHAMDLSPMAVYKWLNGKSVPRIQHLMMLSKMCNCKIMDLIIYTED